MQLKVCYLRLIEKPVRLNKWLSLLVGVRWKIVGSQQGMLQIRQGYVFIT